MNTPDSIWIDEETGQRVFDEEVITDVHVIYVKGDLVTKLVTSIQRTFKLGAMKTEVKH